SSSADVCEGEGTTSEPRMMSFAAGSLCAVSSRDWRRPLDWAAVLDAASWAWTLSEPLPSLRTATSPFWNLLLRRSTAGVFFFAPLGLARFVATVVVTGLRSCLRFTSTLSKSVHTSRSSRHTLEAYMMRDRSDLVVYSSDFFSSCLAFPVMPHAVHSLMAVS